MTNIRTVMGAMDLDQMLSHRDEINERLLRVVDAAVVALGRQGQPHRDQGHRAAANLVASMARQMKAEREKRAEILAAEGQRQSEILRAEGAKQAQILEAEGRREAAFRDAEARERSGAGRSQGDRDGERGGRPRRRRGAELLRGEEILKAFGKLAEFAEPEDADAADRGDGRSRLARRHRRDRPGDLRRRGGARRGGAAGAAADGPRRRWTCRAGDKLSAHELE